ncbi:MFS transporter [Streptomyces sp. ICN441]|uniref:MFS transporter n=1 Tax=Streptomyces tirandamycinicus TaxID=2174846 RepID=A0A2S1T2D1_9ACTN|nr:MULTISPECIES: MFS transporter [Streptomyces]AWI32788.1 MFS transporter [Streptomyces tirandamycinicus]MCY0983688.1 MFS transporter [Streptomyces tirandamycinicus]TFE38834.1 MFS transporter [Streptomyces sp. ICN441]
MTAGGAPKAGRKEWIGLGILALPTLLVALDVFVLLLALPHLSADLGADSNQQLWIMDIYGFMVAGFLVPMGTLGDRIGRRKLLLIGGAAFGAASLLAAFATSPGMLIAARVLLGIAGAAISPSTLALISTMFQDAKQRAAAIGMWASCFTLGAIIGPMLGGIMLEHFWWGSLFLLGVPVMVLLLIAGPKVLPESANPEAGRIDLPSVALNLGTTLPVIYGVKEIARNGWSPLSGAAIVAGVVLGVLFVRRQRGLASPLLDVTLFRHGRFSASLLGLLAYSLIGGTVMLLMTQYFQAAQRMTPLESGLGLLPGMAAATVSFMVCPIIARKIRPAYVIGAGIAGVVAVLIVFSQLGADTGTSTLIVGFAVFSFCGAPLVALGTNMVVGAVPQEKAGSAGALSQISNEFGAALGVATLGTLGLAVYRAEVENAVPAGIPADAAEAARDSVSGAAAAAQGLPQQLADALMEPVRVAFTGGIHTVAAVSAILIAVAGVFFVALMRHVPPIGQEEVPAEGTPSGEQTLAA